MHNIRWKLSLWNCSVVFIFQFGQNPVLKEQLLATGNTTLVEASPRDRTWGIGLGSSNPKATDRRMWRGSNWLGEILTQVREELKEDGS